MKNIRTSQNELLRILVVDDVPDNLKLIAEILAGHGYQVRPASSGRMALRSAEAEAPDLILLDVRMPEMDGYEVCRCLKADERTRSIPVIFISALDETADKVKGFEVGGVDYITKPFRTVEMLKRIETQLSLRRLQQNLEAQNIQLQQEIAERAQAEEELKKHKTHLEELVAARTADLQQEIFERSQTEETLRNSQRRLADIINLLPDATFAIDLEGRVIIWNRAAEEFTGVKSEEMLGKGDYAYALPFHGKKRPILVDLVLTPSEETGKLYPQIRREKDAVMAETYAHCAKGGEAYVLAMAAPLYDSKGNVIGAIESIRDITERRRHEEALRLNVERLGALLKINQMTDATLQEIMEYAFEEAVRLTKSEIGYMGFLNDDETDMQVQVWSRNVMPECLISDSPLHFPVEASGLWGEVVRQRKPIITNDYNSPNPWKKGCPKGHLHINRHMNVPVMAGPKIAMVAGVGNKAEEYDEGDVRQLTLLMEGMWRLIERKKTEIEIREANERFRSVLRAATGYSIIGAEPDGTIKVFNEGAELMLGYSAEEVIDKATLEMLHDPEEVAERAAQMEVDPGIESLVSAARQGETETREWTLIRKDGARITVLLTVAAMRSETGALTGFISIARDVTAEKKLEQQYMQSQKMESVGLLAGGVAHDFNNLLTPILGYTEMLMTGFSEDDLRCKRLQQVKDAADRAKDLTRRLLAFSRKQIIELKTVDLGDIVRQFENMLRRMIRENVHIDVLISPSLGKVRADAGQVELVLLNLSINAQDAMPEGGLLKIEAKDIDLDESYAAEHSEIAPGPYVMLAVSDTGVGMDKKIMEHIFEPFFTTKERGKGTGLGLSTVYGIVKQHGGAVSVYSEKNKGSVFKMFFPRMVDGEITIESLGASPDAAAHGTETILVAEDDEMVRMLTCEMLKLLGYQAVAAESPERGIELAKGYPGSIHLLLTDVVMPGMNGRELFDVLRQMRPDLRVLFMSGYASDVIEHHGVLDAGMAFIQKPFSMHALAEKVRQTLL